MYTELSHYFLFFSIFLLFFSISFHKPYQTTGQVGKIRNTYWVNSFCFLMVTASFYGTILSYACSDFSFYNILTNCNLRSPLFYKISSTWSNHEGSLLLWCWLLSLCGFLFCLVTKTPAAMSASSHIANSLMNRDHLFNFNNNKVLQQKKSPLVFLKSLLLFPKKPREVFKKEPRNTLLMNSSSILKIFLQDKQKEQNIIASSVLFFMAILFFFVSFLAYTSNPFLKNPFLSSYSLAELNPVLQDPVLAIHPPCIYAGYVFSAIGFCLCLSLSNYNGRKLSFWKLYGQFGESESFQRTRAAARQRIYDSILSNLPTNQHSNTIRPQGALTFFFFKKNSHYLQENTRNDTIGIWKKAKFWVLGCWSFLTLGIMLGSWWAYHELGWGGWWFWDPVENASLMPWLLATASLHTVSRYKFATTTLALTLSTFILSILGTFFVRSGLLTSVHSFATDSARGSSLLIFLLCIFLISLVNFSKFSFKHSSRENSKYMNNIEQLLFLQNSFFSVICIVVFCGTCAPIFYQWFFLRDVSTGVSFYHSTLCPLFMSIFAGLVTIHSLDLLKNSTFLSGPLNPLSSINNRKNTMANGKTRLGDLINLFLFIFLIFLFLIIIPFSCRNLVNSTYLDTLYILLCIFLISCFLLVKKKIHFFDYDKARVSNFQPSRLIKLSNIVLMKPTISMTLGHVSVLFFLLGIILSNSMKIQFTKLLDFGQHVVLGSHLCSLRGIDHTYSVNYHSICGNLIVYQKVNLEIPNERIITILGKNLQYKHPKEYQSETPTREFQENPRQVLKKQPWMPPGINKGLCADSQKPEINYFHLKNGLNQSFCLFPEKRFFYSSEQLNVTKVAIHTNLFTDFYALVGTGSLETGWFTTLMKLPFVFCIWLGFSLAGISGVLALRKELLQYKLKWY